jgi:hypothetical protein
MDYRTNHMVHGDVDIVTLVPVPVTSSTVDGVALRPFALTVSGLLNEASNG